MSREIFRRLRQMLMERLDMSRELSDKEILEMIDDLILNHMKDACCSESSLDISSRSISI